MKATLTKKWDGFYMMIDNDDQVSGTKFAFSVGGEGKTKHEAAAATLAAIKQAHDSLIRAAKEIEAF